LLSLHTRLRSIEGKHHWARKLARNKWRKLWGKRERMKADWCEKREELKFFD
jgi:hypothetical protein